MTIPKHIRSLMRTMRKVAPDSEDADLALEFSSGQTEARLSRQLQNDKARGIVKRNAELKRIKGALHRTQDPHNRKRLRQRIQLLEKEQKQEQRFL